MVWSFNSVSEYETRIEILMKTAPARGRFSFGAPGMARSALTGAVPVTVVVTG
jgi:hypothetical protein